MFLVKAAILIIAVATSMSNVENLLCEICGGSTGTKCVVSRNIEEYRIKGNLGWVMHPHGTECGQFMSDNMWKLLSDNIKVDLRAYKAQRLTAAECACIMYNEEYFQPKINGSYTEELCLTNKTAIVQNPHYVSGCLSKQMIKCADNFAALVNRTRHPITGATVFGNPNPTREQLLKACPGPVSYDDGACDSAEETRIGLAILVPLFTVLFARVLA